MRHPRTTAIGSLASIAMVVGGLPAHAQDFAGKTIQLIVPAGAGGGLSRNAQRFAKTFSDHIPGKPSIIVKPMPGGGGQKGINYVFNRAKKDGTQMLWGPMNFPALLTGLRGVKYDPAKFIPLGVMGIPFMTVVRADLAGGLKSREDIVKAKNFVVGARVPGGGLGMFSRLSFDMLGLPYRFTVGYKNQPKLKAALMQNEIQAISTGNIGYWVFYKKDLLKNGSAIDLFYHSAFEGDTPLDLSKYLGDLPTFVSFYTQLKGQAPSGTKYETYKWFASHQTWSMWTMLPPGTPADVVATLRKAYAANWADKRTIASFKKSSKLDPIVRYGDDAAKLLASYKSLSPAGQAYLKSIMH